MSPVTVTVTIANQTSPAERRQPNKEEQKKGLLSVCFFMLNSNKYIEMQWFLLYPFLLSRRVKKFFISVSISFYFFIDLCWIFSSNPDQLSWWLAAQRGGAVWRRNTTGEGGEEEKSREAGGKGGEGDLHVCQEGISVLSPSPPSTSLPFSSLCPNPTRWRATEGGHDTNQRKLSLTDTRENRHESCHTYMYIYVYIYIHIHMYTYIWSKSNEKAWLCSLSCSTSSSSPGLNNNQVKHTTPQTREKSNNIKQQQ